MVGWDTFSPLAHARALQLKKMAMPPLPLFMAVSMISTKYVTFEYILQAAFVADNIWVVQLEPARRFATLSGPLHRLENLRRLVP